MQSDFEKNGYVVVDSLISPTTQDDIKQLLLGTRRDFPWYFTHDMSFGFREKEPIEFPAFTHVFKTLGKENSNYYNDILPIAEIGASYINRVADVYYARTFLQMPLDESVRLKELDFLHVDTPLKHFVVLYYVTDSDGDTILTNIKNTKTKSVTTHKATEENIIARVSPKKGRMLIFDGSFYHVASQPTKSMRCVINFDILW
jgi:hypothetical protein